MVSVLIEANTFITGMTVSIVARRKRKNVAGKNEECGTRIEKRQYNMSQMSEDQKLNKFADILDSSKYVVFLGGAGVSTESGIPDFRSKNGLYHRKNKKFSAYKPEYLLSYDCLKHKPEIFFD